MPKVGPETLATIQLAFQRYTHEVNETELTEGSKYDYLRFVCQFVRWLNDDFTPGSRS